MEHINSNLKTNAGYSEKELIAEKMLSKCVAVSIWTQKKRGEY